MKQLLGADYDAFIESLNNPSQKSVYVNENKISVEDFKNCVDFNIEPIEYEKAGFYVDNNKYGRHPLHHAGAIYLQEPSAMFTVNAHRFKGDEWVLDMCSAPGGKSIQIANRIPNGLLVSNEINAKRSQILYSNIERMGLKNVVITNDTPENIGNAYANSFDVVLVDAPCSGEGMFRKGEDMVDAWNSSLNEMCARRQLEILTNANKALKENGVLIYSTCTYSKLENEDVVNKFIKTYNYELVNIDANFARGVDMPQAVRLYPHLVKGEGQFVAVLKKKSKNDLIPNSAIKLQGNRRSSEFLKSLGIDINCYEYKNFAYYIKVPSMIKRGINYVSLGVKLCDISQKNIEPFHNLFTAFGGQFSNKLNLDFSAHNVEKYLHGDTFDVDLPEGYGALLINNCAVGGFKISKGKFKNFYPKGLRNF